MSGTGDMYPHLCKADTEMLDRLVDVGFDIDELEDLSSEDRQRARGVLQLMGLLDSYPVENADDVLVDATLARIDQYEARRGANLRIETHQVDASDRGFRFRLPDFIAVAAVILIGAAIIIPIMQGRRAANIDSQCANNLAMVGHGLSNFAGDNNGRLPTTSVASLGSFFGGATPDRLDLSQLEEQGYCEEHHLLCPGHGGEGGGFSTQTQTDDRWNTPGLVLVGDRNPVLDAVLSGTSFDTMTQSRNHRGDVQILLRIDGSTLPLRDRPILSGDNIWILDRKDDRIDIFLSHTDR